MASAPSTAGKVQLQDQFNAEVSTELKQLFAQVKALDIRLTELERNVELLIEEWEAFKIIWEEHLTDYAALKGRVAALEAAAVPPEA